jgi:two-component system phosphate regulon sensor histidine kinase PhoR
MFERRSIRWPITLGVLMFVVLVALLIGWIVLAIPGIISGERAALYIALLTIGTILLALAITGTALYLTLTINAINLSRRQSNFIDSVTHELKSPIASLKLYLQTLNRRHLPPAEQETFFKDMLEDVERLDQLINHLLDAARLEKDRAQQEPEEVDLADLLRRSAEGVCHRYHVPPDVVQFDLSPCTVRTIRVDLEMVARNLIDNAIKYADDEQPQIEIIVRPEGEAHAIIRISDNGRGIPPGQRRRIFGRFVRLGSELVRDKPGMGLGLYIVQTLVTRLGGSVNIVDRERGKSGTTFQVRLPGRVANPGRLDEPAPNQPAETT